MGPSSDGGVADVGGGPDDDAACPQEAEAACVDVSEAFITRPRAQFGIFSTSSQMSKKTVSATAERWGAAGPFHHKAINPPDVAQCLLY